MHHPRRKKQRTPAAQPQHTGRISISSRRSGYVRVDGFEEDIEIPADRLGTALHGDTVSIELDRKQGGKRRSGSVSGIIERNRTVFTGTLKENAGHYWLLPDDKKFYPDMRVYGFDENNPPPADNIKVAVRLTKWDSSRKDPEGKLIEVLGPIGAHETEMRAIVFMQGFDLQFPEDVEREADDLEKNKAASFAQEIPRHRDMRGVPTFTIDPEDAKDFDDAISVRELDDGTIELGVHIADVSAYVKKDGAIDKEAQKRGTSIYLVDRTIPMLPEALSNDLCSLVPDMDRLAFSVIFIMTPEGQVLSYTFAETVIRSGKRFHYKEAQDVLDTNEGPMLRELVIANNIASALRKARMQAGSIAFDTDEIKFVLDGTGKPVSAFRKEHLQTNRLIEDLMLLANRTVAQHIHDKAEKENKKYVCIYRVHDSPKPEKIEELAIFLHAMGYDFTHKDGQVTALELNRLFKEIEGKPEQDLIETATIRSMAKAVYSVKNIGHFGLAFAYYTHFTSPIRRYPDLMVHRILKGHLLGSPPGPREYPYYERLALQSSEREIAAVEAERESIKLKQVEYLASHIGETFDGVVTGVTDWGVYIEELTTMAEGLARLRSLPDDRYEVADHGFRLTGSRRSYALGDKVRVRLIGAEIAQKTLEWEVIEAAS